MLLTLALTAAWLIIAYSVWALAVEWVDWRRDRDLMNTAWVDPLDPLVETSHGVWVRQSRVD